MIRLLSGDARDVLPTLPAESVQCVVCSPPYYGLRDYGTALWDGGDAACDHTPGIVPVVATDPGIRCSTLEGGKRTTTAQAEARSYRDTCGKCGAVRMDRQIGLEATPDEYLATMVAVFREVRRVLRRDGTCWVNVGDSYSGGKTGRGDQDRNQRNTDGRNPDNTSLCGAPFVANRRVPDGAKPKDLLLMPARLALALQADGWWVRSDIIWHKPNPMPESVTDRPTSAHEHVFLLTRSSRYYYDADAVREEAEYGRSAETASWHAKADANSAGIRFRNTTTPGNGGSRNLRNVWTIATHAYPQSHFATYPAELAERCTKAGTSERGCCAACGKPWGRIGGAPRLARRSVAAARPAVSRGGASLISPSPRARLTLAARCLMIRWSTVV